MTEEKKIKRIKELSVSLNLINLKDYTKKYFKNRQHALYYWKKENEITIQGSVFIIDKDPFKYKDPLK